MKIVTAAQGSPEWHAHRANHFNASDAPAMMGVSKYTTRTELLRRMALGEVTEVDAATQARFDRGHDTEALARPIIEELIGEELYPAVGVSDEHPLLSASFDGITMDGETGFEHKLWNEALAESVRTGAIADDPAYFWQLEQQILVGGLKRVIFTVSDGTAERMETYTYLPRPGRAEQLLAGWAQFEADLAAYKPVTAKAEVVAAPVETLPAITYTRNGLELRSNIEEYRAAAVKLIERTKAPLVTDQDFADREALCKAFGEAEKRIDVLCGQVVGEIKDVAEFERALKDIAAMFRQARLASEKLVDAEKKNRRAAIQQAGEQALAKHVAGLQARFAGRVQLPTIRGDFAGAIKGKRTLESIQNAVDTELAQRKIEANAVADAIDTNLRTLDELAPEHGFLFRDLQNLVTMPAEAFRATVEGRVATHKAQEAAKLAAEQERIEHETRAKIEREAREKAEAEEAARITAEVQARQAAARAKTPPAAQEVPPQAPPAAPAVASVTTAPPAKTAGMEAYNNLRKPARPNDAEIVAVLAAHYDVKYSVVLGWLRTMNLNEAQEA